MLSLISLDDNRLVLRFTTEDLIVSADAYTIKGKAYLKSGYQLVGVDSSDFEIGKATWNGQSWQPLGYVVPDVSGQARRDRKIKELAKTDPIAALLKSGGF
jgi:hypothetical protein